MSGLLFGRDGKIVLFWEVISVDWFVTEMAMRFKQLIMVDGWLIMNTCSVNACGILNIDNLEMQLKAAMDYETGAACSEDHSECS